MRLHQAIKGAADIMASLHAGLGDALMEFSAHIELLDETVAPDTAGSESKEPYEEAKHRAERESQTTTLLHRAHDALNGVDALRRFLLDICNCVADSSNAEANFSKGALRIIEKYAYVKASKSAEVLLSHRADPVCLDCAGLCRSAATAARADPPLAMYAAAHASVSHHAPTQSHTL